MKRDLDYYRSLPYQRATERFVEEEDGQVYYRVFFEEIPQVQGIHTDRLEAVRLAQELFDAYIQAQLEWGEDIPEPKERRSRKRGGLWRFAMSSTETSFSGPVEESVISADEVRDAPGFRAGAGAGRPTVPA